jgi:hypothetical protein
MKLEFEDELKQDALDLWFEIPDGIEREITVEKADIKWTLTVEWSRWGVESFKYQLSSLLMPIHIETPNESGGSDETTLYAEVKFSNKRRTYTCRIYEDVMRDGKVIEDDYAEFEISLVVEEAPTLNATGGRSQIFVKFADLNLKIEPKRLKLTI